MNLYLQKRVAHCLLVCILVLMSGINAFGAASDVDLSFNAHTSKQFVYNGGSSFGSSMLVQPDGKPLIYGNFRVVNGTSVNRLVRLNLDGSLDNSFNCTECNKFFVSSAVLQPDGKIVVAGSTGGAFAKSRAIRVNSDGSLDPSFSVQFSESPSVSFNLFVYSVQADGKIYVGQTGFVPGSSAITLYRLNSNGSFDTTFTSFSTSTSGGRGFISGVTPLPDGKFYLYGATGLGPFTRMNADGTHDTTYERPTFTTDTFMVSPSVRSIVVQADGKVVITGNFITVNGLSKINIARLSPAGNVDLTFSEPTGFINPPVRQFSDGRLLVLKRVDIAGYWLPERLTANGAADTPLNLPSNLISVWSFEISAANQIYIYGVFNENGTLLTKFARLNSDGSLDPNFNTTIGEIGTVNGLAIQTDGKVLLVGDFDRVNDVPKRRIARVNADGSIDASFDGGTGFNQPPRDVVVDSAGKIYVYGNFSTYNGVSRSFLARLLANGDLDTSFNPIINNTVLAVAFQPDGKILIGGQFDSVNGQTVKRIARINADGSFDSSFAPVFGSVTAIESFFVHTDGKILVGGSFNGVGGFNRSNLVRLNSDGSLDNSFNAGSIPAVRQITPVSGGKYLVSASTQIRKINSDGTVDSSFVSPSFTNSNSSFTTLRFVVLPGESVVVAGDFDTVASQPRRGIVALLPNGQLAAQVYPKGTNGFIYDIIRQADGKIVVVGNFDAIEEVARSGVARLTPPSNLARKTPFDYDGDGKADISVFRPAENKWYILQSSNASLRENIFGLAGDVPVPADYDGDGKTDIAIYRPSTGTWWYLSSVSGAQIAVVYGFADGIPRPSDIDGDGKTDFVLYRPSNSVWYRMSATGVVAAPFAFGIAEDKPLIGDFDGDGKSEPAVFRPSTGDWWYATSTPGQFAVVHWGASGDVPVPADVDADGKTDFVVYRPSNGGWYILRSGEQNYTILQFGTAEDKPVMADYDGDGKADVGVFRPSSGTWYLLQTTSGFGAVQWGNSLDIPTENAFLP